MQPRAFGKKHAGERSMSTSAHGIMASLCCDLILLSWSRAWGVGALMVALRDYFISICPAVDDKAFAIRKER